jgi:hypothetical protein
MSNRRNLRLTGRLLMLVGAVVAVLLALGLSSVELSPMARARTTAAHHDASRARDQAAAHPSAAKALTGSIELVDKPWVCSGPVDLDSVSVTFNAAAPGQGIVNNDAVLMRSGCTGRIGKITVVQYRGDAIKISSGVHDLVVESGSIRCYSHDLGDHQDGVQAMGGDRVTFFNLDDQCLSATNAAFFISTGTNSPSRPTDVVCDGCYLRGGGITVRNYASERSGVLNSRIVTGPFQALTTRPAAIEPISTANTVLPRIPPNADGVQLESTPTLGARPRVTTPEAAAEAVRVQRQSTAVVVSATVAVDRPAHLTVSVVAVKPPKKGPLQLLKQSALAGVQSGRAHTSLTVDPRPAQAVAVRLRLSPAAVRAGGAYRLRVTAQDVAGNRISTLSLSFRP